MATPQNTEIKRKYNTNLRQGVSGLMQSGEDERFVRFVAYREGYDPEEIDNELNLYKRMAGGQEGIQKPSQNDIDAVVKEKLGTGDLLKQYYTARDVIDGLKQYRDLYNSTTDDNTLPTEMAGKNAAVLRTKQRALMFSIAQAEGTGALQEADKKLVEEMLPDVTSLNPLDTIGQSIRGGKEGNMAVFNDLIEQMKDRVSRLSGIDRSLYDKDEFDKKQKELQKQQAPAQPDNPIQPDNEDKAAFDWMRNNPNHPEYERVKSQVESRFGTSDLSVLSGTLNPETSQDTPGLVNPETNEIKSSGFFETISPEEKAKNFEKNLANARAQETQAKSESDYANSFKGFMNNFLDAVGENTGMKKFGQGIGSALFLNSQAGKELQDKAVAGDKYALETLNQILAEAPGNKELIGSAALTALNILSGGLAGRGASQSPKILSTGEKVFNIAKKTIKGGSAGYAYDVSSGLEQNQNISEALKPGLGTVIGASAPIALEANQVIKARKAEKLSQKSEMAVRQIVQGDPKDLKPALETLSRVDASGAKTYKDLSSSVKENTKALGQAMDLVLSKDKTLRAIDTLKKSSYVGGKKVETNYVKQAMDNLKELFQKTNAPEDAQRIQNLIEKSQSEGLTVAEINSIAKEYGMEFKKKAFSQKSGEALTSVNAQAYENTRKGVKETMRDLLPDDTARSIDKKLSENLNTQRLVDEMVLKVNSLEQKLNKRGLLEKAGIAIGKGADLATGHGLRGIVGGLFPSNVGLKTMNALDLQKALQNNIKLIDKALGKKSTILDKTALKIYQTLTRELGGKI